MIWRIVERNVVIILIAMIIIDVAIFARVLAERRDLQSVDTLHRLGIGIGSTPPPDGFGRDGKRLDIGGGRAGWAVRYAGMGCEFCRNDYQWKLLAPKLQELGFQVIVLLPTAQEEFPKDTLVPGGALQEAYVDIGWIKRFRLTLTPTLLIFDPHQHLIWHRVGALNPADTKSALWTIDAAKDRGR